MDLRQISLLRWNSYMDECIGVLETSSDALPSDRVLCQWVKLQRLTDDITAQLQGDSPMVASDPKSRNNPKGFEHQLSEWEQQKPKEISSCESTFVLNDIHSIVPC